MSLERLDCILKYLSRYIRSLVSITLCVLLHHSGWSNDINQENCFKRWPSITLSTVEVKHLTKKGIKVIQSAGEHPSYRSVEQIVDYLGKAAIANATEAQKHLGFYVYGYWMTDLMFWPKQKRTAVDALAMLRIFAIKELNYGPPHQPLLQGLGVTPPHLDDELLDLPNAWVSLAVKAADHWQKCFIFIKGYSPIS